MTDLTLDVSGGGAVCRYTGPTSNADTRTPVDGPRWIVAVVMRKRYNGVIKKRTWALTFCQKCSSVITKINLTALSPSHTLFKENKLNMKDYI